MFDSRANAKQLIQFDGISYMGMRPTDLDGVFDVKGKAIVFFQVKYNGAEMPRGQRLLLQRLVTYAKYAGRDSIAIVADHYVKDPQQDIYAKDCIVRKFYYSKDCSWHVPTEQYTVLQIMDRFTQSI